MPTLNRLAQPCTRAQREYIDRLHEKKFIYYSELMEMAHEVAGRSLRDIGDLNRREASALIDQLKER